MRGPRRIFSSGGRDRRPSGPPPQPSTLAEAAAAAGEAPPRTLAGAGHVTVYARSDGGPGGPGGSGRQPEPAGPAAVVGELLRAISGFATGDTFCSADPDAHEELFSATISDTVATFVIEVAQDPLAGALPAALCDEPGWDAHELIEYEISVAGSGPGADRLRYRLAKAVVELTGGVLTSAGGAVIAVESLADPAWGGLW
jgi:hypothetical protein